MTAVVGMVVATVGMVVVAATGTTILGATVDGIIMAEEATTMIAMAEATAVNPSIKRRA
jgi:hypothetical protein